MKQMSLEQELRRMLTRAGESSSDVLRTEARP